MAYNATIKKTWNGHEVKIQGKKVIGRSVLETALSVQSQARALCPVDTGRLSASIVVQMKGYDLRIPRKATGADIIEPPTEDNVAYVGTAVFYGPYVEFGTIRSGAQPFLRPAADLAQGKVLTILEKNGRFAFAEYLQ